MDKNTILYAGSLLSGIFGQGSPIYIPWGKARQFEAGNYELPGGGIPAGPLNFDNIRVTGEVEAERLSWMGTPVMGTFTFMSGQYNSYRRGQIVKIQMPDFLFPYATIVTFSRAMNMTQTKILGASGTVKEIYGLDDWEITIQGVCLTDTDRPDHKTADEQAGELTRWRGITDTINVSGNIFSSKDIYALCVKNLSINPERGKPGVIPFTIEAVSDEPVELVL